MKKIMGVLMLCSALLLTGCSPWFWGGTATGVGVTGGGYEINAKKEMNRIDDEYKSGKITKEEYEIRKDQIRRMAVFQ